MGKKEFLLDLLDHHRSRLSIQCMTLSTVVNTAAFFLPKFPIRASRLLAVMP